MTRQRDPHVGGQQLPLVLPDSSWRPPAELPDLRRCGVIVVDVENRDDGLAAGRGSGWPTRAGHLVGVAVAWEGGQLYAPTRHPCGDNLDQDRVRGWLRDHLRCTDLRVVMHHCQHDVGWLRADWELEPPANLDDTEGMAALVDENRLRYSLDSLCEWRGLPGKDERLLLEAGAAHGYHGADRVKASMWRLPARFVGPYAEADAAQTLALARSLEPVLRDEGTHDAYRLEMAIAPMVHEMRRRGVRVDVAAAERAEKELLVRRDATFAELSAKLGRRVGMDEIGRTRWLQQAFDEHGIGYPRTAPSKTFPRGQPSFTGGALGWMGKHAHWLPQLVVRADRYHNAATKFLRGYVVDYAHRGRLHAAINQYRGEEGGARTNRFSYSDPPLQQMAARDKEIAPMIRGVFVPEEGEVWCKKDYGQQEYRLIVHFSELLKLGGASAAGDKYRSDPNTDFHEYVVSLTGLDRGQAKNTNFAKAYRAGIPKFAAMIERSEAEAAEIYAQYDRDLPFVAELGRRCQSVAERRGWLRLLDGARLHFDRWESAWSDGGERLFPTTREKALEWQRESGGRIKRAHCYAAMNGLVQGSAARQTKAAMLACWREGLVPLVQLHDELDFSVSSEAQGARAAELMREAVKLTVPVRVDVKYGRSWADAKHNWQEIER